MANYGATSLTTLLQMVGHGLGVTLIPEMAAEAKPPSIPDLKIVPFAEPAPSRQIRAGLAQERLAARRVPPPRGRRNYRELLPITL